MRKPASQTPQSSSRNTEGRSLLHKNRDALEPTGLYSRYHDKILFYIWILMATVQWNCLGETLNILKPNQPGYSNTRFLFGIGFELLVSLIFTLDFVCYKLWFSFKLPNYNTIYFLIDLLSGPLSLAIDILSLMLTSKLNIISTVFRACKFLSGAASRRVFKKVLLILPKVKDMFFCLFCVFFLFTYIATYLYSSLFQKEYYFNTIGFSFFTMLQIMTLDGWGEIGREILRKQNMLSASFLILFVFIMAYFFWNILIGFILDILRTLQLEEEQSKAAESSSPVELIEQSLSVQSQQLSHLSDQTQEVHNNNNNLQQTHKAGSQVRETEAHAQQQQQQFNASDPSNDAEFFENICFGSLNYKMVMIIYLTTIIDSMLHKDLQHITATFSQVLHMSASILYTFQVVAIYFMQSPRFKLERQHKFMMAFHLISGPIALGFDLVSLSSTGSIGFGAICKLVKVFTITREMIMGAVVIFPVLLPAFLGIISIIFILAIWALAMLSNVENFWVDFNTSVYTFVQILTLDDWAAKIMKDLIQNNRYLTPIVFVGFIFVANYFFLNMMVAFSSEVFEKLSTKGYVERNKNKKLGFYEASQGDDNVCKSVAEFIADVNASKDADPALLEGLNDIRKEKQISNSDKEVMEKLLKAKYSTELSDQKITFECNGKSVEIRAADLKHIKFDLFANDDNLGINDTTQTDNIPFSARINKSKSKK